METKHRRRKLRDRTWNALTDPWIPAGCMVWIMVAAFLLGCIVRYMLSR